MVPTMSDVAANIAGIRAGTLYANQTTDWNQLHRLEELASLLADNSELFAASMIADEVFYCLFPERAGDGQASWEFWRQQGGQTVCREFIEGFIVGAVEVLSQSLVAAVE